MNIKLKQIGLIFGILLLLSCENTSDNNNSNNKNKVSDRHPLNGYWIQTHYTYGYPVNDFYGRTYYFIEEKLYDGSIDNFFNANIIKFKDSFYTELKNVSGPSFEEKIYTYELMNDSVNIEFQTKDRLYTYEIEDDVLVMKHEFVYPSNDSVKVKYTYERIDENNFPQSWGEVLLNDSTEPNDDYTQAETIEMDVLSETRSLLDSDTDFFSFQGEANKKYLVRVKSHINTFLKVYKFNDNTGNLLNLNKDYDNDGFFNDIGMNNSNATVIESDEAQTYYIKVFHNPHQDQKPGYYQVIVTETDLPYLTKN